MIKHKQITMHNYIIDFGKYKSTRLINMKSLKEREYCKWLFKQMEENTPDHEKDSSHKYKAFRDYTIEIERAELNGERLVKNKQVSPLRYGPIVDYYDIYHKYTEEKYLRMQLKGARADARRNVVSTYPKQELSYKEDCLIKSKLKRWDWEEDGIITQYKIGEEVLKGNWDKYESIAEHSNKFYISQLRRRLKKLIEPKL